MGSHRVGHDWSDLAAAASSLVKYLFLSSVHFANQSICLFFYGLSLFLKLCIYLIWLHWVFVAACERSLVMVSGDFSCCRAQALGAWASVVTARRPNSCGDGLIALRPVESSQTRDQTHVLCIGRQILIHCTTREVGLFAYFLLSFKSYLYILHVSPLYLICDWQIFLLSM